MIVTKEYCDRCGKEVESEPLSIRLFPIICRSPRWRIRFRDKLDYIETTKMVCEDCMKAFWAWWKQEKDEDTNG